MERAWEDQPEGEDAGEIQALGGGIQIYSVVKDFHKPQIKQTRPTSQSTAKAKGRGRFKPKLTQHVNAFLQEPATPYFKPPGLPRNQHTTRQSMRRNSTTWESTSTK